MTFDQPRFTVLLRALTPGTRFGGDNSLEISIERGFGALKGFVTPSFETWRERKTTKMDDHGIIGRTAAGWR